MKVILMCSIMMLNFISLNILAKSDYFTYKCHILVQDNREVVTDVVVNKNSNIFAQKKVIKKGYKLPQNKPLKVLEVYTCINSERQFTSANARKLDEEVLR